MNTADPLNAANPAYSACVLASAGTGKTWLLVARLTRLLLNGVEPRRILAITFTRKAAGEMQQRLLERLQHMLQADDRTLDTLLSSLGESPDAGLRERARGLFESVVLSEQPLRTATFHSFCQDLLKRFPLEAGLPPGFELADTTGLLFEQSWDALFAQASQAPEGELVADLDLLFDRCGGLFNVRKSLFSFLHHRSDWWAYTQHQHNPVAFAHSRLGRWLELDPAENPAASFWQAENLQSLTTFADLLARHPTQTNDQHLQALQRILAGGVTADQRLEALIPVFFTSAGERRKRTPSKTRATKMGVENEQTFLALHERLCQQLEHIQDRLARRTIWQTSVAWYRTGALLLDHYQRIKRERRLVDFTDLEWKAYELLSHPEQAHWIQYKVDARIDHLLIDEFQDTNPTQWRLLKPILDELAAGNERERSLFLVGDAKQSIYRFRRGDPALLNTATSTMQRQLHAGRYHLDRSWRSAPAILECVNSIFTDTELGRRLPEFAPHDTHHAARWGRVEIWPLFDNDASHEPDLPADSDTGLRNPLRHARRVIQDQRHLLEGRAIARRIRTLVDTPVILGDAVTARPAEYNDIIILLRSRTHLGDYEAGLRAEKIPYLSMDRGTLLDSLEVRDMEALLNVLMTPEDNLSLAQVLRSPIFSVTDADLVALSRGQRGAWIDSLASLAATLPDTHPLVSAQRMLEEWQALAGRIPIHDLLDGIYHRADILRRYQAAFPAPLMPRVRANLIRFIELALEVDAGRYPSLPHFLSRLRQLRRLDDDAPDQAIPDSDTGQRVRIMTIHAAKGLEAPIVFLADCARQPSDRRSFNALVRWPAEDERPSHMLLTGRSRDVDGKTRALLEQDQLEEHRESANLLYVALTRARQLLFISGCRSSRRDTESWYHAITSALIEQAAEMDEPYVHETGSMPVVVATDKVVARNPAPVDPRLLQPLAITPRWIDIAPSEMSGDTLQEGTQSGRLRGRAIHRLLQLAGENPSVRGDSVCKRVVAEFSGSIAQTDIFTWWQDVSSLMDTPEFDWLFNPDRYDQAYNEVPIQFAQGNATVFGIIDRLVIVDDEARIVDYKTHQVQDALALQRLCAHYSPQLDLYHEGVARLWPNRRVSKWLLFTHPGKLLEI